MPVTWHWEKPGELAHARRDEEGPTLCGAEASPIPLMRPPFPKVRCETCDTAKGNETEHFPNLYLKG